VFSTSPRDIWSPDDMNARLIRKTRGAVAIRVLKIPFQHVVECYYYFKRLIFHRVRVPERREKKKNRTAGMNERTDRVGGRGWNERTDRVGAAFVHVTPWRTIPFSTDSQRRRRRHLASLWTYCTRRPYDVCACNTMMTIVRPASTAKSSPGTQRNRPVIIINAPRCAYHHHTHTWYVRYARPSSVLRCEEISRAYGYDSVIVF